MAHDFTDAFLRTFDVDDLAIDASIDDPALDPDPCPNHTDEPGPHHSDICCYYDTEAP